MGVTAVGTGREGARRVLEAALVLAIVATFVTVGWTSPGYDDEFYNVMAIARTNGLADLARHILAVDVHPPGSYLANAVLFDLTGSWAAVRALTGAVLAASLVPFLRAATAGRPGLFVPVAIVVGLHPTLAMWGPSLRWTGPFTALLLTALTLILRDPARPALFWGVLAALLAAMAHVNYETLLFGPALLGLAVHVRCDRLGAEWRTAAAALAVAVAACLPLALAAAPTLLGRRGGQTGTILASLAGAGQGFLVNAGLFPLSAAGLANVAAVAGLGGLVLAGGWRKLSREPLAMFWLGATALLIVTGLAAKPRNATPLIPVLFALLVILPLEGPRRRLAAGLLVVLTACQGLGLAHVLLHLDTAKGSWNLPVPAVLEAVRERARTCPGRLHVAVHDVVLANLLAAEPGLSIASPYTTPTGGAAAGDCLVALATFRGSLGRPRLAAMLASLPATPVAETRFGPDPHAAIKRRFDPDVPDVAVRLLDFGSLAEPVDLAPWQRRGPP
ncbi:hypothetical protein [Oharaeibacter diazotrophicus]|uniref:Dolichyl-phosphate-mannose-protein mannosyltransferase n=3 Tax=Oharaeibacter diazotrophicus TaxID=1920512 RepID=A0A4R6RIS4_9HYPH|nr:hypothetical protein [Oharaeibacter diazotrophicus]TDP86330.1 hypothetical protein EDD54_0200 [Oharaeibacter diazotrophicus]BBE71727.1 hypothetical protein OHA_1_01310 [Pleomorphomonas sp. SM30]GLS78493.1 hypothetical protein GCM10007904_38300 [Oharaeibacter diazotrophicus]